MEVSLRKSESISAEGLRRPVIIQMVHNCHFRNISFRCYFFNTHALVLHICNHVSRSEHLRRKRAASCLTIRVRVVNRGSTVGTIYKIISNRAHGCKVQSVSMCGPCHNNFRMMVGAINLCTQAFDATATYLKP